VGLNALQVPLVHHGHGVLGLEAEELTEDALVPLVNQDGLLLGGGLAEQSHEEVDAAAVQRLGEGLTSPDVGGLIEILVLAGPGGGGVEGREEGPPEEGVEVEIGLQSQRLNGDGVKLRPTEHLLGIVLGSVLEGICGLQAGCEDVEIIGEPWMGRGIRMADSKKYLQER
jgi:hypothetical protein